MTDSHETHHCCDNRLAKEGRKARCCTCVPHDTCTKYKRMQTIEEKIEDLATDTYKGDCGSVEFHERFYAICREYALSCKPKRNPEEESFSDGKTPFENYYSGFISGYNTALEKWEKNMNKPL